MNPLPEHVLARILIDLDGQPVRLGFSRRRVNRALAMLIVAIAALAAWSLT
jgi:hypothetical protein